MLESERAPLHIALLLHETAEASRQSHIDLLLSAGPGPIGDDERTVRAWRCPARPDEASRTMDIVRIDDHRGLYLRLDGPRDLGRGRGLVRPLRCGVATQRTIDGAEEFDVAARWSDGARSLWRLRRVALSDWVLEPAAPDAMSGVDFPSTAAKAASRGSGPES